VYPALAVLSALGERAEVLWVGGQGGMEAALVQRAGIRFDSIPAAGLHGVGLRMLPANIARLLAGIPAAHRILKRFNPDVLFFTGGYVGVPVAIAGRNRPQVVFTPDIEPGFALRLISRFADLIAVSTDTARDFYSPEKNVLVSGYPIRPTLKPVPTEMAREKLGLDLDLPVLLVFGGSRGARSINEALWRCLPSILTSCQVLHITGELDWARVSEIESKLMGSTGQRYHPHQYLHEDMALALSAADLVVSRAGAATMGEFPCFGLPAILIPYPHAWRYQHINAEHLKEAGGAIILPDEHVGETLEQKIMELLQDEDKLQSMRNAMHSLDQPGAAERLAEAILELAGARSGTNG
jgi:undecaprenyldiphospho-muramoylpentapeptide beta-N-acetylglucosaminyltransferase